MIAPCPAYRARRFYVGAFQLGSVSLVAGLRYNNARLPAVSPEKPCCEKSCLKKTLSEKTISEKAVPEKNVSENNMYRAIRPVLFRLDPEVSHTLAMGMLDALNSVGVARRLVGPRVEDPGEVMGLRFPNRVGLAAGLDKNADHLNALGALGFGFIEVGTVTPQPQPGNPKPRLFRLAAHDAIINRFGFNNKGVAHLVKQVRKSRFDGVIGINIGKNLTTSVEDALSDYLACLDAVHEVADYITVNISSPNTPGLRTLQFGEQLDALLGPIRDHATALDAANGGPRVPY